MVFLLYSESLLLLKNDYRNLCYIKERRYQISFTFRNHDTKYFPCKIPDKKRRFRLKIFKEFSSSLARKNDDTVDLLCLKTKKLSTRFDINIIWLINCLMHTLNCSISLYKQCKSYVSKFGFAKKPKIKSVC